MGEARVTEIKDLNKIGMKLFYENQHIDAIIHFAAFKAVRESVQKTLEYYRNNLTSLMNLLECMSKYKVEHMVFSSSCTVYGQPDVLPVTELTPRKEAESPYGNTKAICEDIIKRLSFPILVIRPPCSVPG